ncbi:Anthranilate synthase [Liberibacter crescens BT-1]|uniref:Anthranilate synthase n=1 Tax=Liberibacter crescens (strain BT-1) TaxID=1215343 RepID=L0EVV1_LIBCB|nr:Anthranilate synthase [Liberibacter crescens BT-1]
MRLNQNPFRYTDTTPPPVDHKPLEYKEVITKAKEKFKRGKDPIADHEQILKLLNSQKDRAELTMCPDVDRNDKSRVCKPGSVKVSGRRQIEIYSRLIHLLIIYKAFFEMKSMLLMVFYPMHGQLLLLALRNYRLFVFLNRTEKVLVPGMEVLLVGLILIET